jgi:predicted nucleic-acid-binding protein
VITVDTNVLVRVLVDDPGEGEQVSAARDLVRRAGRVYVPQVVQAETVWVLESAYELPKAETVRVLEHLLANQAYVVQEATAFRGALESYRAGSADFADYLILAAARAAGTELVTFDRRLARSSGVILAGPATGPG